MMNKPGQLIRDDARRRYGEPPAPAATWARLAPHLPSRGARRRRPWWRPPLLVPLAAVLVALLALGVVAFRAQSAPVGAAEILARAGRAAGPTGPATVRAFRGTLVWQSREARDTYQTSTYDPATAPLRQDAMDLWFRSPGDWRTESAEYLGVAAGSDCWSEDRARRRVFRVAPAHCDFRAMLGPAEPGGIAGADGRGYRARLGDEATIAGRPAYTIAITLEPLPVPTTGVPPALAYPPTATDTIFRTLWIDRETYLLLGSEDRDPRGTLLVGWAYTAFVLDPPLDPTLFVYTPPPGYAIIDQRHLGTPQP